MPPESNNIISSGNDPGPPAVGRNAEGEIAAQNSGGSVPEDQSLAPPLPPRLPPPPPLRNDLPLAAAHGAPPSWAPPPLPLRSDTPLLAAHGAPPSGCPPPYDNSSASTRCLPPYDDCPPPYDLPPPYDGLSRADQSEPLASQGFTSPTPGQTTARHTVILVAEGEPRRRPETQDCCCSPKLLFYIVAMILILFLRISFLADKVNHSSYDYKVPNYEAPTYSPELFKHYEVPDSDWFKRFADNNNFDFGNPSPTFSPEFLAVIKKYQNRDSSLD